MKFLFHFFLSPCIIPLFLCLFIQPVFFENDFIGNWFRCIYFSCKLGEHDTVILSDFDCAKEVLSREDAADRPEIITNMFMTNFKNVGEFIMITVAVSKFYPDNDMNETILSSSEMFCI